MRSKFAVHVFCLVLFMSSGVGATLKPGAHLMSVGPCCTEFDHVVLNCADTDVNDQVGECESHINKMREELGLPLRANYFFTASSLKADPNFNTRFVRLPFEQIDPRSRRLKRYWLTWDFTVVGGIPPSFNRLARSSADIF